MATGKPIEWFEQNLISRVPLRHRGAGRRVYPGFLQLTGFMTMNLDRHLVALRAASAIPVNDTNTDGTPRYLLANLRASKRYALNGALSLELLARIDNLFDKVYAGSVIVNDANGRFFEPGAPRTLLLSLKVSGKP